MANISKILDMDNEFENKFQWFTLIWDKYKKLKNYENLTYLWYKFCDNWEKIYLLTNMPQSEFERQQKEDLYFIILNKDNKSIYWELSNGETYWYLIKYSDCNYIDKQWNTHNNIYISKWIDSSGWKVYGSYITIIAEDKVSVLDYLEFDWIDISFENFTENYL